MCAEKTNHLTLYFKNIDGKKRIIAHPTSVKDTMAEIKKFIDDHNFKSFYTRVWPEDGMLKFDVGSHCEFFYLDGMTFDEFREENSKLETKEDNLC